MKLIKNMMKSLKKSKKEIKKLIVTAEYTDYTPNGKYKCFILQYGDERGYYTIAASYDVCSFLDSCTLKLGDKTATWGLNMKLTSDFSFSNEDDRNFMEEFNKRFIAIPTKEDCKRWENFDELWKHKSVNNKNKKNKHNRNKKQKIKITGESIEMQDGPIQSIFFKYRGVPGQFLSYICCEDKFFFTMVFNGKEARWGQKDPSSNFSSENNEDRAFIEAFWDQFQKRIPTKEDIKKYSISLPECCK